ncbi:phage tail sheath C-terminal domain-containing protein [Clostridiaceae bacterium M8S5]|nr:phage tail sheath C-terminal domain-containing protein [Clostridiaceae bacterium M8S5]
MGLGLPKIEINFKTQGVTAIERSAKGIVALILKHHVDVKKENSEEIKVKGDHITGTSFEYKSIDEIGTYLVKDSTDKADDWGVQNLKYIKQAFLGTPSKVIVEYLTTSESINDGLGRLKTKKWNYLAIPEIMREESTVASWVSGERTNNKKTFKVVLPNEGLGGNCEGIINFCASNIKTKDSDVFSGAEYAPRIAGILAGLPFTRSATYYDLGEVVSVDAFDDSNKEINEGKLILINDGEKVKIARGVNAYTQTTVTKGESFKKIKIVDAVDLMTDDIRDTFNNYYVGKITNSYDHKVLFLSAINAYFKALEKQEILDPSYDNKAQIDIEAQKLYLQGKGLDVSTMKEQQIKEYNTGSQVFISAKVKLLDAMEDLMMEISM